MSKPKILPTREGYDLWAATYDTMGNWLLELEEPEVDRAIGDVAGLDVLDVGTGTGRHAIRLAERGAEVVAIDFSEEMLAIARAKRGAERVRFATHDVTQRLPYRNATFDRVLSALVLEHVQDVASFFRELARVVRPSGRIVVSAMHPAMFLKGVSANFHDGQGAEIRPRSYVATISDYVMGALAAGLTIVALSEHAADGQLAERHPNAQKWIGWPSLFVMTLSPRAEPRVSSGATTEKR